ncbi:MAG: glycine cleavage system protein GcvH [Schleiferiaceae bacterium]|jgi:glycine cleavage system H protein|nr:MAG: glycine cleavage system protein H [Owenweeksia sp. TMED14]|tara:strand:- start:75 stop:455 length:381 start_codon:yes stop_codon:yes gene_type:complete
MNIPSDLKYTKDHEWVRLDGEIAIIGITDFAQGELGDIVFIDIDSEGDTLKKEEVFGSVEAVKTVSDLYVPLDCEIIEVNPLLDENPELVNEDPYQKGWMVKAKITDLSSENDLLTADQYSELVGN